MSKAVSTDLTFVEHHPGCGCSPCSPGQPGQPSPLVPVQGTAVATGYEPVDKSGRCGCCSSYYRSVWDRLCQQLFGYIPAGMDTEDILRGLVIWTDGVERVGDGLPATFRVTATGQRTPLATDIIYYKEQFYNIGAVSSGASNVYTCTECLPIEASVIEAYKTLVATNARLEANETVRRDRANQDHARADADHDIASADHQQYGDDHFTAGQDHAGYQADHERAANDHTAASGDRTRAAEDHSRADADHDTAQEDHSRAGNDHSRADADHARSEQDHQAVAKAVLFTPQTLTEGEKAQARENIGVEGTGTDTEAVHFTPQTLTAEQKEQARTNIGAGTYSKPSDGIPASDLADGVIPDVSGKADKDGEFPDMLVGTAESLLGTGSQVSDFVFSPMPGADGIAKLNAARGKSLVWNQLVSPFDISERTREGATFSVNAGVLEIVATEGTSGETLNTNLLNENTLGFRQQAGHKYYSPNTLPNGVYFANNVYAGGYNPCFGLIQDGRDSSSTYQQWSLKAPVGTIIPQKVYCPIIVFDLTLMFGAGNEPASVSEFEAMFPLPYYDYEPGRIISNKTESVKVTGFNQWDEEWEKGSFDSTTGEKTTSNSYVRTKNPVRVFPGANYYLKVIANGRLYFYDASLNFISVGEAFSNPRIVTIPSNCHYINYRWEGTSYSDGICINLSDPARNGQYEPYKTNSIQLNLPTLTGKLNGEGESVVVFPEGLKSAGSVYDEIVGNKAIKRVGVVDLGSLDWSRYDNGSAQYFASYAIVGFKAASANTQLGNLLCVKYTLTTAQTLASSVSSHGDKLIAGTNDSKVRIYDSALASSDVAAFKTAMSGVMLYYELATPEEYILDEPLTGTFRGYKGGTIKQLPENTATPVTAPMVMEATYPVEAKLEPEIFWATYGVTTASQIDQAVADGKAVMVAYNGKDYLLGNTETSYYYFGVTISNTNRWVRVHRTTNVWSAGSASLESIADKSQSVETDKTSTTKYPSTKAVWDGLKVRPVMDSTSQETVPSLNLENTANKSQDIPTDRESTTKYPSVKAVFDSLGKWGIISQTQTWTGSDATGYDYTMSNPVWGLIPQANIDLYEAAGAVFNESTGYFELNDLTDISYNEMKIIYAETYARRLPNGLVYAFSNLNIRTNFVVFRSAYALSAYGNVATGDIHCGGMAEYCQNLSSFYMWENDLANNLAKFSPIKNFYRSFYGCTKLKRIVGALCFVNLSSDPTLTFVACYSLQKVYVYGLKRNLPFNDSPRLELESIAYVVRNAANTTAITITLHPTAFARCQADTTEYTYNGNTYTGIIAYANAKNITIASA